MQDAHHIKLGDNRRLVLPADLCRKLGINPGDELLVYELENGIAVASLRGQAEQMRRELREMLPESTSLAKDLKKLRQAEAAREAGSR